jgi:hypothetical protein
MTPAPQPKSKIVICTHEFSPFRGGVARAATDVSCGMRAMAATPITVVMERDSFAERAVCLVAGCASGGRQLFAWRECGDNWLAEAHEAGLG